MKTLSSYVKWRSMVLSKDDWTITTSCINSRSIVKRDAAASLKFVFTHSIAPPSPIFYFKVEDGTWNQEIPDHTWWPGWLAITSRKWALIYQHDFGLWQLEPFRYGYPTITHTYKLSFKCPLVSSTIFKISCSIGHVPSSTLNLHFKTSYSGSQMKEHLFPALSN